MRLRPVWVYVILGGFLVLNLVQAIAYGGRWNWSVAALLAGMLAWNLWRDRRRGPPTARP